MKTLRRLLSPFSHLFGVSLLCSITRGRRGSSDLTCALARFTPACQYLFLSHTLRVCSAITLPAAPSSHLKENSRSFDRYRNLICEKAFRKSSIIHLAHPNDSISEKIEMLIALPSSSSLLLSNLLGFFSAGRSLKMLFHGSFFIHF